MAKHRHKRDANARLRSMVGNLKAARLPVSSSPTTKISAGLAVLATAPLIGIGVVNAAPALSNLELASSVGLAAPSASSDPQLLVDRTKVVSRSASRRDAADQKRLLQARADAELARLAEQELEATELAIKRADTKLWTTAPLNLWTASTNDAQQVGEIDDAKQVLVTGRRADGRAEIVLDGKARWVTAAYLSEDKPLGLGAGLSMDPCPDGSVESGLTSNAIFVYRSVCNAFPQITSYGGWDNHGEHTSGRAIDIMTSDPALGTAIAEFLRSHAAELNLYDVIWSQHIWTPVRAGEGWRYMSNRGSATANHYDHVHVSVY